MISSCSILKFNSTEKKKFIVIDKWFSWFSWFSEGNSVCYERTLEEVFCGWAVSDLRLRHIFHIRHVNNQADQRSKPKCSNKGKGVNDFLQEVEFQVWLSRINWHVCYWEDGICHLLVVGFFLVSTWLSTTVFLTQMKRIQGFWECDKLYLTDEL